MQVYMKKGVLLLWFVLLSFCMRSQDNCFQFPSRFINIINNPSFEVDPAAACTSGYFDEQGLMIPYWTTPTDEMLTGYLNACTGFLVPQNIIVNEAYNNVYMYTFPLVPQPIPDGNGVAAVADFGSQGAVHIYPFHKSYVSTCLSDFLEKDSLYELDFYVGFGVKGPTITSVNNIVLVPEKSISPEKFTLFGYTNCSNNRIPIIGCPAISGWTPLGSCLVYGDGGTWVKASIKFKSPDNFLGISLGPGCDTNLVLSPDVTQYNGQTIAEDKYSYFLDKLELKKSKVPAPELQIVSRTLCSDTVVLQVQPAVYTSGFIVQWLKNNVVIDNENNDTLIVTRENYGAGLYQCRIQNDSICLTSDTVRAQLISIPDAQVLGASDTVACVGDTVMLNAFTDPSFTYVWQDGSTAPYFFASQNGNYSVAISSACETIQVHKNISFQKCDLNAYVPNAFTPNGDGRNDFFRVRFMIPPSKFKMNIYTRYGQKVFSTSDFSAAWDGSFKGSPQPAGTYVYIIEFKDRKNISRSLKGALELIR